MKRKSMIASLTVLFFIFIFGLNSCIVIEVPPPVTTDSDDGTTATTAEETTAVPTATTEEETTSTTEDNGEVPVENLIRVTKPVANQLVSSPMDITGEARGTWYFEATFPVKLLDANGNTIATHYATAQGEWMTEDFVPFVSELEFEEPGTSTGTLVLEKSNPSGLPENAAEIRIPVRFE